MFVSNEKMIGMKVTLTEGVWTEKGYYTRGHIMKIKDLGKWGVFVLEDDNGELALPVNGFHLLEEEEPDDEVFQGDRGCHGTQRCPGFQEDFLAVARGIRRGRCAHAGPLFGGCRRSDYQKDMEAWRECLKSST